MKIVIQFKGGARAGQQMELDPRPRIRLGRHPDNDVTFDPHRDLDVSGHHAEIVQEPDGWYLADVGSANGTFVLGNRVQKMKLISGHQVSFGASGPSIVVSFVDGAQAAAAAGAGAAAGGGVATAAGRPPAPGAAPTPGAPVAGAPPAAATPGGPSVAAGAPGAPPASAPSPAGETPGQAVAQSLEPGRKVGARTVGLMIDAALERQAKQQESTKKGGKSTMFFRSMVDQAVKKSSRKFKVIVILLSVLLVGGIGGVVVLFYVQKDDAGAELRKQMAALMAKQGVAATSEEKQRLAKRLDELNKRLAKATPAATGKLIVQNNLKAIFLLAFQTPIGQSKGFCTAFSIRKRVLATNAHCIVAMQRYQGTGLAPFVVMNRAPTPHYRIVRVVRHPAYHKPTRSISEDVGLVFLDTDVPVQVKLAPSDSLKTLDSGDVMYTYGFPGRLAVVTSPNATLVQGVIGRLTKLDGALGKFEENKLIQHSAFTSGGTSGSPIFNPAGEVVAINAGGYVEPGTLQVMDPLSGRARRLRVAKQLAGYNFGIRVDVLRDLMQRENVK
ncbi:MAG: FHA domain-containing protein [Myxococcales bacterium]|nr:FHA domain-containing protein [Myxococcales bacterium]